MGLFGSFACNMPVFDKYYFYSASFYLAVRGSCMVYWSVLIYSQTVIYDRYSSWKDEIESALITLITVSGVHIALALCIGVFAVLYFDNSNFKNQCTSASSTTIVFALTFLGALIAQSVAAIYILVWTPNARDDFREAFSNYGLTWEDTHFVDKVQRTLYCCGMYSYRDYRNIGRPIAESCCLWGTCTEDRVRTKTGCLYALSSYGFLYGYGIEYKTYAISVFTVTISVFEFIACIFGLCLAKSIKKRNARSQGTVHNNFPVYSTQNIPTYMTQNIPNYMTQNIPNYMTQNIPTDMTQNIPSYMTQSNPTHMTQSIPSHIAKIPDTQKYE